VKPAVLSAVHSLKLTLLRKAGGQVQALLQQALRKEVLRNGSKAVGALWVGPWG
jgi:hypothetical protein